MRCHDLTDETNLAPDSTDMKQALRVVIASLALGKHALRVISGFGKELGSEIGFQLFRHDHSSSRWEQTA